MQEQITKQKEAETVSAAKKQEFEDLKQIPTHPNTRVVKLIYQSCCGCGCHDVNLYREVQWDAPEQDGDRTDELLDSDRSRPWKV